MKNVVTLIVWMLSLTKAVCQSAEPSITDLEFLVGTWQTEEKNEAYGWWEKSTRTGSFILENQYLQLESSSVSSSGKQRTYRFLIHYDKSAKRFEMVCLYSNWPKVRIEFLDWNKETRTLTLKGRPMEDEYSERIGTIQFSPDFREYIWTGTNKSGDPKAPKVFEYVERGKKM